MNIVKKPGSRKNDDPNALLKGEKRKATKLVGRS
jgi:hypothetical protein